MTKHHLAKMIETRGEGLISIFMPTHPMGAEVQKDPIRLGNLVGEAERHAKALGLDPELVEGRLKAIKQLRGDLEFWRKQRDGLALFASEDGVRIEPLIDPPEPFAFVGDRYNVRPLLTRSPGGRFHVLALSQGSVRFWACDEFEASPSTSERIPASIGDALGEDHDSATLQVHSGNGSQGGVFHGQGRGTDDKKDDLQRFLRVVDDAVTAEIGDSKTPLVLAGVDYLTTMYRALTRFPHVADVTIAGNPDRASGEALRQAALDCVAPWFETAKREAEAAFVEIAHTPRAVSGIDAVLPALHDGRVATLFLQSRSPIWGRFDEATGKVTRVDARSPGDDDLLDRAIAYALAAGTEVFPIEPGELATKEPISALLRY